MKGRGIMISKLTVLAAATVVLAIGPWLPLEAQSVTGSYTEHFTTTEYRDSLNTTCLWDTVAGELKLPPFELQLVRSYEIPGEYTSSIAISGDYAYVMDKSEGLHVVDISDPTNPTIAGSYDHPTDKYAFGLTISGNYAYVAHGEAGLVIIDISDPTNPILAGSCSTPNTCNSQIDISGNYVYVASRDGGLRIIDVSDPTNPTQAGYHDPGQVHGVAVSGNYVYIGDDTATQHRLLAIDISDPTNPFLVGQCSFTDPHVSHIVISGDYAYVGDHFGGLQVVDISDPTNPTLAGSYDTPGWSSGIAITGDYAYVADEIAGLQVIYIGDPNNPILVGNYNTPGRANEVAISGDLAYVVGYNSDLQVVRIAEPVLPPVQAGIVSLPHYGARFVIAGDHVYVGGDNAGLQVIDISDPQNPLIVGSVDTPDRAFHIDLEGNYVYLTDYWPNGSNTFYAIDVIDPTNPTIAGIYSTPDHIQGLDIDGDYAYVCNGAYGFKVLDINDPTNPTLAGNLTTSDWFHVVTVSGDYAYVGLSNGGGLLTVDISDPTNPTPVGGIAISTYLYHIKVCGDYAYACCMEAGLVVLDISDPTNPIIVGSYDTPGDAQFAAVEGDYAYVADRSGGVHVLDVTDPTSPTFLGNYMTPNVANCVGIAGDHAFVTTGYVGYLVVLNAFQRSLDTENNAGMSLALNEIKHDICKVSLSSTETGIITWSVSADNGVHWEPIVPGAGWHSFTHTGSELMWKSQHFYDLTQPDVNPTCSFLEMEWIYSHIEVGFDIKPGSCPNPFNVKDDPDEDNKGKEPNEEYAKPRKGGVLPAAIVGSEELDVNDIDVSTILLEGIAPIRSNYEDVTRPVEDGGACACTGLGPDGYLDLTLKFSRVALAEVLGSVGNGEVVELTITGGLLDGTPFEGSDCVTIVGKRSSGPKFEEIDVVELGPPVPNPFNPMTRISYSVPDACVVSLEIFDSSGKLIIRLLDNVTLSRGMHTVEWRGVDRYGRAVDSGVYFYRLIAGDEIISRKMVLLR